MLLDLREIHAALGAAIGRLEAAEVSTTLELSGDFYWWIPQELLYDMRSKPMVEMVGSLSHDLELLRSSIGDNDTTTGGFNFVWLGALLRAFGDQLMSGANGKAP